MMKFVFLRNDGKGRKMENEMSENPFCCHKTSTNKLPSISIHPLPSTS